MSYYLTFGLVLGLTAGFSPGPLLTLVISETLARGLSSGVKVALAPMITDVPIVIVTLLVATQLSNIDSVLGVISLIGGGYVLYMAYESTRQKKQETNQAEASVSSLAKGVLTNTLSPNPYLFWLSIGAPTVAKAMEVGTLAPILFIGGFYISLIGSKVLLAVLVGKSRSFLNGVAYLYTMRLLALMLSLFSIVLFLDGLALLGVYEAR